MTEKIGVAWQEGEDLASRGQIHEALVQFQRAKALLIVESQSNYSSGQTNPKVTQILGEIMMKLTTSVEKNVAIINKNPIVCLKLKPGFTKKDVKKAYKQQALRYHPDKNPDCDTSCIFTAVQSAYEILLQSAPADPVHRHDSQETIPPRSTGRRRETSESHSQSQSHSQAKAQAVPRSSPPQKSHYHSTFLRRPSHEGTNPETKSDSQSAKKNADYGKDSGVAQMSTEQIRRSLQSIGFIHLEGCSREELVRRYLAAKSHFSQSNSSETSTGRAAKETFGDSWGEKMHKRMEKERQKEWNREDAQAKRGKSSSSQTSKKSSAAAFPSEEEMPPNIPILSIGELMNLCHLRNISTTGCVEKNDLINLLYKSFGVEEKVIPETKSSQQSPQQQQQQQQQDSQSRPASATKSFMKYEDNKRPPSSSSSSSRRAPSSSTPSNGGNSMHNLWTRDRLKEMEAKLRGNNRKENNSKRPPSPTVGHHEDGEEHLVDDWTPIDKHLAEEASRSSKFVSKTSDVTALEEELLRAQKQTTTSSTSATNKKANLQNQQSPSTRMKSFEDQFSGSEGDSPSDSDSEEIEWIPVSGCHHQQSARDEDRSSNNSSGSGSNKESFLKLNIPSHGIMNDGDDDDGDDDDNEEDDEDEESIFLNPEMTPLEIKAMRLKRFEMNYQRSLSSTSPGKTIPSSEHFNLSQVHVGVTLLDDDEDEDDEEGDGNDEDEGDEEEEGAGHISRFSPQKSQKLDQRTSSSSLSMKGASSHSSPQYRNSPSATAWMPSR